MAVLTALVVLYFFHIRLTAEDLPFYRKLVQESIDLHAHSALERSPVRQIRKGVSKDIWTINDKVRLHSHIESKESDMTLTQKKEKIEALEILWEIEGWSDSGKQIRHLTAESGTCHFPSCLISLCQARLYHARPKTWNFDCAKTARIDDHKRVHISNIDPFMIVDSSEFSRWPKSKFQTGRDIYHARSETWSCENDWIDAQEIRLDHAAGELLFLSPHGTLTPSVLMPPTRFDADTGLVQFPAHGFTPQTFLLEGNVQLASYVQGKECVAIADAAIFHIDEKKVLLESAPHSRVLFRQEGIEGSAPTVHIHKAVQAFGDVRFFFYPEEKTALDTIFLRYTTRGLKPGFWPTHKLARIDDSGGFGAVKIPSFRSRVVYM